MRPVVLDFETFFTDQKIPGTDLSYRLRRTVNEKALSTEEYIRHPWFQAHGAAIKWSANTSAQWYHERELRYILKEEDWSDVFLISHHAQFDHLILSHHYNVRPKMSGCSLSMARLLLGNHLSVGLEAVRTHFGLSLKKTPYDLFRGKHWNEMTPEVQRLVGEGACDEVESIWTVFGLLMKEFPIEELEIVDMIVKMFSQPVLRGDSDLLAKVWEDEERAKAGRLKALNVTADDLQSADRFAELLRLEGIEPDTKQGKVSTKTGKSKINFAFAKTDQFMRDLLEYDADEDEEGFSRIRTLAEARLGEKSTFMQTRAANLGWMASRGPLCVYLRYAGAGTLRVAGGDGSNWLNQKRNSDIRRSVLAPDGYWLAPVDASQIECRVAHYLAGGPTEPVIQLFARKEDPYTGLASQFYKEAIYKPKKDDPRKDEMEAKRGMGKQGRLMCQFGASGKQFKETAKNGLYGPPVDISIEDANAFVKLYRETNTSICGKNSGYWAKCENMLAILAHGNNYEYGPLTLRNQRIYLPNGCPVIYDTLHWHIPEPDDDVRDFERNGYWRMKTRQGWKKMWGSKLTQNICEAVSRVIVSQAAIRIARRGYRILNWPYDELLCLIPRDTHEDQHVQILMDEMTAEVPWLPGLPLDAECTPGERYEK